MELKDFISAVLYVAMPIYISAFFLYTVRIFRGPTIADMVLAVDALSYDLAAFLIILSLIFESPLLVVCAYVIALWIYALDIYVAKYIEKEEMGD